MGPGEDFAGYTVVRRLGTGGMGEVYLVEHPRLPRLDALKVLGSEISSSDDYRQRFIREADLAGRLWHPNIVRVNDRGECDGRLWIAMDYIDGEDASQLLRRYPAGLPTGDVLDIVDAVAAALDYAHNEGFLHRDVKPANILLTHAKDELLRRIMLTDFGIAREIGEVSGLTVTNTTVGTVAYSAPEQLTGEHVDGRADQYALAATAYHLLTGSQLFPSSNAAIVIGRHLNATPRPVSAMRTDLAALDPVFAKALAKDPENRYPRCVDFAQALRLAASGSAPASPMGPTLQSPIAIAAPSHPVVHVPATPAPAQQRSQWLIPVTVIAGVAAAAIAAVVAFKLIPAPERSVAQSVTTPQAAPYTVSPIPTASATKAVPTTQPPRQTVAVPRADPSVSLPASNGSVFVTTRSGRTACQINIDSVGCGVDFVFATPVRYGSPANGVRFNADGAWDWIVGDIGNAPLVTLSYDTVYHALGWIIYPTNTGTTFTNERTRHGMTVSVDGVNPF